MKELAGSLGYPEDREKAGRVLKAVLHALRNRLTIEESIQLIAQLPMFLKAVYVESWSMHEQRRIKHLEDFYEEIKRLDGKTSPADFETQESIHQALTAILVALRKYISLGELEDLKAVLPKELKGIFNPPVIPS